MTTSTGMGAVTAALGGRIAFGGDYNPEQWPEEVWAEDVTLMREAGVNLVTVGVFSWALLQPAEDHFDFGWLDRVLDLLHAGGIAVDLATATASPPPWFTHAYPESRLVDDHGVARGFGARQNYCPSSAAYRAAATRLAGEIARRYGDHPAVVLWHVNNEYGCHNWHCYCDASAAAFRTWLRARYGDLDALNASWGTAFWSQRYTAWEQIDAPRAVSYNSFANPGQQLDWWRFGSDELLACHRAEVDAIRATGAGQPITTNFMSYFKPVDYRSWTPHVDLVANDHYLQGDDPENAQQLAMASDLMRSLARGRPWLVMEHSTSAVNWQRYNVAKRPGEMIRNSLQHVARGADGALFFQWRSSFAGAEKFHSGLVPHAGRDTKVWREVVELGTHLRSLAEVAGTTVEQSPAALLFDWRSWWAAELDSHPSVDLDVLAELRRWHDALWARNVGVDVVGPADDLAAYRLVVVPVQYLLDDAALASLTAFAEGGGTVVVTYFSAIVDDADRIRLGGYPGGLRDLVGVTFEEFFPLPVGGSEQLTAFGAARLWSELGRAGAGTEVLAAYASGPVAGSPAVTRRVAGDGAAWYVGTVLDTAPLGELVDRVLDDAGVEPVVGGLPSGVEALRRVAEDGRRYLFLVNHTDADQPAAASGTDLLTGNPFGSVVVAGGVAVVRED